MFFSNYKKCDNFIFNEKLLWEFNITKDFDWFKMRHIVVKRVIELGKLTDYYAIFNIYGGIENIKKIIKEINFLSKKDMNFVSVIFNIKKEDLKCYKRMQLMKKHIFY